MIDGPLDPNVKRLPVKYREPPAPDRTLLQPHEVHPTCDHLFAQYIVHPAEAEVTCGKCKTRLNPMWVLHQIASHDRRYAENQKAAKEASKRLDERSRTKCEHCDKMTRISRR